MLESKLESLEQRVVYDSSNFSWFLEDLFRLICKKNNVQCTVMHEQDNFDIKDMPEDGFLPVLVKTSRSYFVVLIEEEYPDDFYEEGPSYALSFFGASEQQQEDFVWKLQNVEVGPCGNLVMPSGLDFGFALMLSLDAELSDSEPALDSVQAKKITQLLFDKIQKNVENMIKRSGRLAALLNSENEVDWAVLERPTNMEEEVSSDLMKLVHLRLLLQQIQPDFNFLGLLSPEVIEAEALEALQQRVDACKAKKREEIHAESKINTSQDLFDDEFSDEEDDSESLGDALIPEVTDNFLKMLEAKFNCQAIIGDWSDLRCSPPDIKSFLTSDDKTVLLVLIKMSPTVSMSAAVIKQDSGGLQLVVHNGKAARYNQVVLRQVQTWFVDLESVVDLSVNYCSGNKTLDCDLRFFDFVLQDSEINKDVFMAYLFTHNLLYMNSNQDAVANDIGQMAWRETLIDEVRGWLRTLFMRSSEDVQEVIVNALATIEAKYNVDPILDRKEPCSDSVPVVLPNPASLEDPLGSSADLGSDSLPFDGGADQQPPLGVSGLAREGLSPALEDSTPILAQEGLSPDLVTDLAPAVEKSISKWLVFLIIVASCCSVYLGCFLGYELVGAYICNILAIPVVNYASIVGALTVGWLGVFAVVGCVICLVQFYGAKQELQLEVNPNAAKAGEFSGFRQGDGSSTVNVGRNDPDVVQGSLGATSDSSSQWKLYS